MYALNECYNPRLLTNNPKNGEKVFVDIINYLKKCDSFMFCVAFLNMGGYQILFKTLDEISARGIKGKIVVSEYQTFTEPKALRQLKKFSNIELKIVPEDVFKMHSKGYIFKKNDDYTIIVGSSNLTQNALASNKEWNVVLNSKEDDIYVNQILTDFDYVFDNAVSCTEEYINEYEYRYNLKKAETPKESMSTLSIEVRPNSMQVEALANLKTFRDCGENKSLVISATGTGKTILSALDVKQFNPKKFLFIVHREKILKDAIKTYKRVLGKNIECAIFGGNHKEIAQYTFSMIQTLSKDDNLELFDRNEFDYIVFDEVHRIGSQTYKKVFNYFKPKFVLGMTATPERTDGFNIFSLFNYNIACDIRLQDALDEDLICPFHYYAVSDFTVDNKIITDKSQINDLTDDVRINHIIDKIQKYGYYGDKVKGLVFVSRIDEAKKMSDKFNLRGFKTVAITGDTNEKNVDEYIQRLESDKEDHIDYIFTVDKFNEGIDIKSINQVIFLRPTESAIIFVQQLGRGLRKNYDKDYVVVLDFVGNYDRNFLIPIALTGDKTGNKDNLRRFVYEGNKTIVGASTVEFEKVVEQRILDNIDRTNFSQAKVIKDAYKSLKNKLGKIPSILDFKKYGSIDPIVIFKKFKSYYDFLLLNEHNYTIRFNEIETKFLRVLSQKYSKGQRPHELEIIKTLINKKTTNYEEFKKYMLSVYPNYDFDRNVWNNLCAQLTNEFFVPSDRTAYNNANLAIRKDDELTINSVFLNALKMDLFRKEVANILNLCKTNYDENYLDNYNNSSLVLYKKYSYEDFCRVTNWMTNEQATIFGYRYKKELNIIPIMVNYNKESDISESIKYGDEFINNKTFKWHSKHAKNGSPNDVKPIIDPNNTVMLFVRKNKNDQGTTKEFYFLGYIRPISNKTVYRENTKDYVEEIIFKLNDPVREDIYDYLTGGNE